jgi:hypothetical protein
VETELRKCKGRARREEGVEMREAKSKIADLEKLAVKQEGRLEFYSQIHIMYENQRSALVEMDSVKASNIELRAQLSKFSNDLMLTVTQKGLQVLHTMRLVALCSV